MLFFVHLLGSLSRLKDLDIVYVPVKVVLFILHCILGFFFVVTTTGACSGFVWFVLTPLLYGTFLHLKMCSFMPR